MNTQNDRYVPRLIYDDVDGRIFGAGIIMLSPLEGHPV